MKPYYESFPDVKRVIHSKAHTVVVISGEHKGVTRCQPGIKRDPEKGFWIAYAKAQRSAVKHKIHINRLLKKYLLEDKDGTG